jgi:hypothetical protein
MSKTVRKGGYKHREPRNLECLGMLLKTKPGNHGDKRREERKTKARMKIIMREEGY